MSDAERRKLHSTEGEVIVAVRRNYICECGRNCKRRLWLAPDEYEKLAAHGSVVSMTCADERSYDPLATNRNLWACAIIPRSRGGQLSR